MALEHLSHVEILRRAGRSRLKIILYGEPIPKKATKFGKHGAYNSQATEMKALKQQASQAFSRVIEEENNKIELEAISRLTNKFYVIKLSYYVSVPDSDTLATQNAKLWGFIPCNAKPDLDNLNKLYFDIGNEIFWDDDRMIVEETSIKKYSKKPRLEIEIMRQEKNKVSDRTIETLKVFGPDKLKDFLNDVKLLSKIDFNGVEEINSVDRDIWLTSTSMLLINFAQNYATDLKKITKFADKEN
jgi:Holliday junction resolvase RusA-like endonuclease